MSSRCHNSSGLLVKSLQFPQLRYPRHTANCQRDSRSATSHSAITLPKWHCTGPSSAPNCQLRTHHKTVNTTATRGSSTRPGHHPHSTYKACERGIPSIFTHDTATPQTRHSTPNICPNVQLGLICGDWYRTCTLLPRQRFWHLVTPPQTPAVTQLIQGSDHGCLRRKNHRHRPWHDQLSRVRDGRWRSTRHRQSGRQPHHSQYHRVHQQRRNAGRRTSQTAVRHQPSEYAVLHQAVHGSPASGSGIGRETGSLQGCRGLSRLRESQRSRQGIHPSGNFRAGTAETEGSRRESSRAQGE